MLLTSSNISLTRTRSLNHTPFHLYLPLSWSTAPQEDSITSNLTSALYLIYSIIFEHSIWYKNTISYKSQICAKFNLVRIFDLRTLNLVSIILHEKAKLYLFQHRNCVQNIFPLRKKFYVDKQFIVFRKRFNLVKTLIWCLSSELSSGRTVYGLCASLELPPA